MSELTLFFYEDGSSDPYNRVNWPSGRPHLQALLAADEKLALVNTSFIIANTAPGYRVYFVSYSPWAYEHENMKESLKSMGVLYEERVETLGETTVGFFRRHKVDRMAHHIFSSTDRREVVRLVFDSYTSWESGWPFFFFIARDEPAGWKELVGILSRGEACPADLILKSHCIMRTVEDHGIMISSIDITKEEVRETAANLARELSMYLTVRRFVVDNSKEGG